MRSFFSAALIAVALAGCTQQSATPAASLSVTWDPSRTWVFAVGVLEWEHADVFPSFPQEGRRDVEFVNLLIERGVPREQMVFLRDSEATRERLDRELREFLSTTTQDSYLIFFYAGHGVKDASGETYLANHDATRDFAKTAWSVTSVVETIDRYFKGSHVLLSADNCYSGSLVGKEQSDSASIAYASLTASLSSQPSTANWTFTENLIAGFRGDPLVDVNRDGGVTLQEIADHNEIEMAFVDGQSASFVVNGFNASMVIAPTHGQTQGRIGERVEAFSKDGWYRAKILDHQRAGDAPERFRVHYVDYDPKWDEWVSPEWIREWKPKQFAKGVTLDVAWSPTLIFDSQKADWYPARVLDFKHGLHLIHYDGYTNVWDEWVAPERIRAR